MDPQQAPGAIPLVTRRKPGTIFFITISILELYYSIREDFIDYFDDLISYVVAVETSKSAQKVSNHLHAFLEFANAVYVDDLREYISVICTFSDHIDVQPCRSKKSCVKYISKEDLNLVFNVKISDLHFNYRVFDWARSIAKFDHTHPFVTEHRFCYNFLAKYYKDFKKNSVGVFGSFRTVKWAWAGWALDVVVWWNRVVSSEFVFKRQCLFLYGPSNTGKTSLIEFLVGRSNMKFVFYPGVGHFFMQDFDPDVHKIIMFEEFDFRSCTLNMLKRLLEGRPFAFPVKGGCDKIISFRGPIIFVSNDCVIDDVAIQNRLFVVSAETPYWQEVKVLVPKVEDPGEAEEIIAISSASESERLSGSEGHDTS